MLFANRPLLYVSTEGEETVREIRMEEDAGKKKNKKKNGGKKNSRRKS